MEYNGMCSCQNESDPILSLFEPKEHPEIEMVLKLFQPEPPKSQPAKAEWHPVTAKQLREASQYTPEFVLQRKMARFR